MEISLEFEIGIVEYRNILKVIKETYNYDFSDYALISFKRRIERVLQLHNLKHADVFIEKLREDPVFFQHILQEISVESTEMFRDPSFWRYMRDELFPVLIKDNFKTKIWFPSCVSGDELYTLAVILHEQGWSDKFEIVDSNKVRTLGLFIDECKAAHIALYIFVSPYYVKCNGERNFIHTLRSLTREKNVPLRDYSGDPLFLGPQGYFADINHLNIKGAELYTRLIIHDILHGPSN